MSRWRSVTAFAMGTGAVVAACASGGGGAATGPSPASPSLLPIPEPLARAATFEEDLEVLRRYGEVETLVRGGARIAVSAKYQGRVMTSAVAPGGTSLGWVHRTFLSKGVTGTPFDNYGGEDRLWLGPEGGQFGLFFPPGKPFDFASWQTPHEMQEGAWAVEKKSIDAVTFRKTMHLTNWSGAAFTVDVTRTVALLDRAGIDARLRATVDPNVAVVAFESQNQITNAGAAPWTEDKGLLSAWVLGMFTPAADARIVVPFDAEGAGPVVNDAYFGKVPADRLAIKGSYLVFSADGKHRSKIGLGPTRARSVAGSYSPSMNLLTIVQLNRNYAAPRYVNSMWEKQRDPYGGDVINAYNDGPVTPGGESLGGFYELETSSPALRLAPGDSATHVHRTYHFIGQRPMLDAIARSVLGVSLDAVAPPHAGL